MNSPLPLGSCQARRALLGLTVFCAVSAAIGTVMALALQGAGVPVAYLAGTPFRSFLVPGLILGGLVGGTQLVAAISLWQRRRVSLLWSAIAAFGMMLWVFVELAMLQHYSWLQAVYFALGVVELVLVLVLLGIVPRRKTMG